MFLYWFPSTCVPAVQVFPSFFQLLWMGGFYLLSPLPCLPPSTSCRLSLTLHAKDAAFTSVTSCHQWPVIDHTQGFFLASRVIFSFSCNVWHYRLSHAFRTSFSQWILWHSLPLSLSLSAHCLLHKPPQAYPKVFSYLIYVSWRTHLLPLMTHSYDNMTPKSVLLP